MADGSGGYGYDVGLMSHIVRGRSDWRAALLLLLPSEDPLSIQDHPGAGVSLVERRVGRRRLTSELVGACLRRPETAQCQATVAGAE